jgi:hypothetical protein
MGIITFDTLKSAKKLATKNDLLELKYDLLKWFVGLGLTQIALLLGVLMKH